jgi:hypothetical protein
MNCGTADAPKRLKAISAADNSRSERVFAGFLKIATSDSERAGRFGPRWILWIGENLHEHWSCRSRLLSKATDCHDCFHPKSVAPIRSDLH